MSRDQLKNRLKEVVATVTFVKKDGTLRQMRCTLKDNHLPVFEDNQSTRKENDEVLPVWDVDNGGWRSFRMDSIKSVSFG